MSFRLLFDLYKLRRNQWLKASELEEIQQSKLRRIVKHAYKNVKYYRKLFDSVGVKPEDIRTPQDLVKIPITSRSQLQKLPFEEIIAEGVDITKCKRIVTSGSSGIPLTVILTKRDSSFYDMVWMRAFLGNGQKLWYKTASMKFHIPKKLWIQHLGIWRKEIISVLDDPMEWIDSIKRIKPDILRGNSFNITYLAKLIREKKIEGIRPKLIFSYGSLLDQQARALISSTFKTKVFDYYGMTELGCIAWECTKHRGYHINVDAVVLELIKGNKRASPGEMGRIICTGLHSFAMPFIRYDTGDIGILSDEKCPCGRGLPLLKSVEGRADDFFVFTDGTLCSPSVIVNQIKLIPGISQFKLVQESETEIVMWLVPSKDFSQQTRSEIKETIQKIMGDGVNVEVRTVKVIPSDSTRKMRQLVSKVKIIRNF